jgi:high affinity Mn2+ porin
LTRRALAASAAFLLTTSAVLADGPASIADFAWTGAYVGGHLGANWGASDWQHDGASGVTAGSLGLGNPFDFMDGSGSYTEGLQAGYDHQFPSGIVLGAVADISFPNLFSGTATVDVAGPDARQFEDQILMSGTVRGRLGYAFGNVLAYGTAGYGWGYEQVTRTELATGDEHIRRQMRNGWVAGGGVEAKIGGNWSADLAYLFADYGNAGSSFPDGDTYESQLPVQNIRLGINYRVPGTALDGNGPQPLPNLNDWAVHAQTTYVIQADPNFRSPYVGPQSLIPGQQHETWDATLFLGRKLWSGAEFWINPEIDQGYGLSNTYGVAGFPSGEAYKVGNSYPYARIPRYFIRDTISLGGKSEKVDADINQFAGTQTENRLVFTLGKFAVTDIFDENQYAHDPRSDFLNWALVDTGTFDYAADAWGYTYGTAVEWYQGDWTLRAGIFDLSVVPNSSELDPSFSQFQTVYEIEHRHKLYGQPGKIAVTGFLSRGRMGSYADAVALADATGEPAEMAPVREYRSRYGIGFNIEQQATAELGFFARGGLSDGDVEPFDFTDIDRTLAGGMVLKGKDWGRPNDVFGIGGVVNFITDIHAQYFNAGGLGIVVGDGKLPNPGAEMIVETYYAFPIARMTATLDYQFVNNPGYNEDRGPVSILGARLHSEF